ncbi:Mu transposase domain-containing protein [Streptomyces europaeiscabiei]|uniref:Mu transposase domain-containing protein n=1 Tax=Streptomyces europaeiscabiei TaxID=146819 RepID=UPI00399AAE37
MPPEPFETAMTFQPRVDRYSRITVRMCSYSVPARFIDRKVAVHLTGDTLVVFEGRRGRRSPVTSGLPDVAWSTWSWTTTWRCCCASPGRLAAPRRCTRPRRGHLHCRARGILGPGQAAARRDRRDESPGQDPGLAPSSAARRRDRGPSRRHRARYLERGRGGPGGPQVRTG